MRSTWVRTIRLQQYRFSCSWSRASLEKQVRQEKAKEATDAEIGAETNPSFMSFARSSR